MTGPRGVEPDSRNADSGVAAPQRCSFCARPFARDDAHVLHYREGEVIGTYHESCRPDRRRSGCGGSRCG